MPFARILPDLEVLEAACLNERVQDPEDPLLQDHVYEAEYICRYCSAKVEPAGIGKLTRVTKTPFKIPPYFGLRKKAEHDPLICDYTKATQKPVEKGKNSNERLPINPYPNRLSLDWFDRIEIDRSSTHIMKENSVFTSNWSASSITPLVSVFIDPSRRHLPLSIPGVEARTYNGVFQKIFFPETYTFDKLRVYFGEVIYSKILDEGESFTFFITDGTYDVKGSGAYPRQKSKVKINAEGWNSGDLEIFRERIKSLKECSRRERQKGESNEKYVSWLFFLGVSKVENNSEFSLLVDNWRLVSFCVTNKLNNIVPDKFYEAVPWSQINDQESLETTIEPEAVTKSNPIDSDLNESEAEISDIEVTKVESEECEHKLFEITQEIVDIEFAEDQVEVLNREYSLVTRPEITQAIRQKRRQQRLKKQRRIKIQRIIKTIQQKLKNITQVVKKYLGFKSSKRRR